jgi:hypothetical protein
MGYSTENPRKCLQPANRFLCKHLQLEAAMIHLQHASHMAAAAARIMLYGTSLQGPNFPAGIVFVVCMSSHPAMRCCTSTSAVWKIVDSGGAHTCGIVAHDDTISCWGGTPDTRPGDLPIGQLRWKAVSVGGFHTCGILMNDTVRFETSACIMQQQCHYVVRTASLKCMLSVLYEFLKGTAAAPQQALFICVVDTA